MRKIHEIIVSAQRGETIEDSELREAGAALSGAEWSSREAEALGMGRGYFEVQMDLVRRWRALPVINSPRPQRVAVKMATCERCGMEFPARQAMSSSRGTVCPDCYMDMED
jgi:hypothetical protein